jgi:hypothetical protein
MVMHSIMPPRPDYAEEERLRFERLPDFPLDSVSWKEFAEKMQSEEGTLFALRIMPLPQHQELIFTRRSAVYDELIFGRRAKRLDDRIGRTCFGNFIVMEGNEKKRRLKLVDGLGKDELHPAPESDTEWQMQLSNPLYLRSKISELILDENEALNLLGIWLQRRTGYREEGLTKEAAFQLKAIRFIMRQVFPDRATAPEKISPQLHSLDHQLQGYIQSLHAEISTKEGQVALLKEEISSLE